MAALYSLWAPIMVTDEEEEPQSVGKMFALNIMDTFVCCFIPAVIIFTINFLIAWQLRRYFKKTVSIALTRALECINSPNARFVPIRSMKVIRRSDQLLTRSLIICTTVYVVLFVPNYCRNSKISNYVLPEVFYRLIADFWLRSMSHSRMSLSMLIEEGVGDGRGLRMVEAGEG